MKDSGHWHVSRGFFEGEIRTLTMRTPGPVGECCAGFMTWEEAFGAADE